MAECSKVFCAYDLGLVSLGRELLLTDGDVTSRQGSVNSCIFMAAPEEPSDWEISLFIHSKDT